MEKKYRRPESVRSPVLEKILEEMERDPWHVKLKRWWRVEKFAWICLMRWEWNRYLDKLIRLLNSIRWGWPED